MPATIARWWPVVGGADELPELVDPRTKHGAIHPTGNLAKDTLACLAATDADPDAGRRIRAAADLHQWWKPVAFPGVPILARS